MARQYHASVEAAAVDELVDELADELADDVTEPRCFYLLFCDCCLLY